MTRQSTRHTNISLDRWYGKMDTKIELHDFIDVSKIVYRVACLSDLRLTTNQNAVFLCQNSNLYLPIKNQNRFRKLNYNPP